jgi:hypothetical protein
MAKYSQHELIVAIVDSLTPELLKKRYRDANPNTKIFKANFRRTRCLAIATSPLKPCITCWAAQNNAVYICMVSMKTKLILQGGHARRARGEDVRPEGILAASVKQEPTVKQTSCLAGILCLKAEEGVNVKPSKNAQIVIRRARKRLRAAQQ